MIIFITTFKTWFPRILSQKLICRLVMLLRASLWQNHIYENLILQFDACSSKASVLKTAGHFSPAIYVGDLVPHLPFMLI